MSDFSGANISLCTRFKPREAYIPGKFKSLRDYYARDCEQDMIL